MNEVTRILSAMEDGDPHAAERLLPLVYDELRRLAAEKMAAERPGQTLQATALVHEAYLRLIGARSVSEGFANRRHFFAAAAEAMRRILIEHARRKKRVKHGGGRRRAPLADADRATAAPPDDLLALDDALTRLAQEDDRAAEVVKLRYYAGLSVEEAAAALGISRAAAYRHWAYARAWLRCALADADLSQNP